MLSFIHEAPFILRDHHDTYPYGWCTDTYVYANDYHIILKLLYLRLFWNPEAFASEFQERRIYISISWKTWNQLAYYINKKISTVGSLDRPMVSTLEYDASVLSSILRSEIWLVGRFTLIVPTTCSDLVGIVDWGDPCSVPGFLASVGSTMFRSRRLICQE